VTRTGRCFTPFAKYLVPSAAAVSRSTSLVSALSITSAWAAGTIAPASAWVFCRVACAGMSWRCWRWCGRAWSETRRQGDKETRRQGDKETRRQGDNEKDQYCEAK